MSRILHLISSRKFVGEAARVLDLCRKQNEMGHFSLTVTRKGYTVSEEARRRGIPFTEANFGSRFNPVRDLKDVKLIQDLVAEHNIDLIHCHRSKEHWLAAYASKKLKPKVKLLRSRHVVTKINDNMLNRWLYSSHTEGVICVSISVREATGNFIDKISTKSAMIPGGIDPVDLTDNDHQAGTELREKLHIEANAPIITMLARINEVKGHLHVVRAMPEVLKRFPDAVFIFAYSRGGDYRIVIEEEAMKLGVRQNIRWLAELPSIRPLLSATDIGLIASTGSEGWSRAAVEYLSCGIPVVATNVGSLPEIVIHNSSGMIVPPESPAELSKGIESLLADKERYNKFAETAKTHSRQNWSLERLCRQTLDFYNML